MRSLCWTLKLPSLTTPPSTDVAVALIILLLRLDPKEPLYLHLLVDSTGPKIYGEGEWLDHQHGMQSRRRC